MRISPLILMAAKFNIPVCPDAGGVALCEYVQQHLSIFDSLRASTTLENRVTEFVDHLHEHLDEVGSNKRRAPEISDARHSANHFARRQKPTSMLFSLCSPGRLLTIVRSQTSSRTT
jgi:hypothetical protein